MCVSVYVEHQGRCRSMRVCDLQQRERVCFAGGGGGKEKALDSILALLTVTSSSVHNTHLALQRLALLVMCGFACCGVKLAVPAAVHDSSTNNTGRSKQQIAHQTTAHSNSDRRGSWPSLQTKDTCRPTPSCNQPNVCQIPTESCQHTCQTVLPARWAGLPASAAFPTP